MTARLDECIEIDGSQGEGGGQVLRSALALSVITGQMFRLYKIRAHRSKPGLMAQHLQAVDAAAAVGKADVEGAYLGSSEITFRPSGIKSGRYKVDIGTAGSAMLVLQTVFIPLSLADSASSVIITGGTHVPKSPCFHYIEMQWLPYLSICGFDAHLSLETAGFYPRGGGRVDSTIRPVRSIAPLDLIRRGALQRVYGLSAAANLPVSIAERQKRRAFDRIQQAPGLMPASTYIKTLSLPSPGKGTFLLLLAEFEGGRACFFSLGALGKPAEIVADQAVDELLEFIETGAAIDSCLADQLLLPLALADGVSRLSTSRITSHLLTNAGILRSFLNVRLDIEGEPGAPGIVSIEPQRSWRNHCTGE